MRSQKLVIIGTTLYGLFGLLVIQLIGRSFPNSPFIPLIGISIIVAAFLCAVYVLHWLFSKGRK